MEPFALICRVAPNLERPQLFFTRRCAASMEPFYVLPAKRLRLPSRLVRGRRLRIQTQSAPVRAPDATAQAVTLRVAPARGTDRHQAWRLVYTLFFLGISGCGLVRTPRHQPTRLRIRSLPVGNESSCESQSVARFDMCSWRSPRFRVSPR